MCFSGLFYFILLVMQTKLGVYVMILFGGVERERSEGRGGGGDA